MEDESIWKDISDELKTIIFHRYFIGKEKGGRWGDKWNDENKDTKRLKRFIDSRVFDEYGNIIQKCCSYSGSFYPISDFGKDKKSRDGFQSRCKKHSNKRNRR